MHVSISWGFVNVRCRIITAVPNEERRIDSRGLKVFLFATTNLVIHGNRTMFKIDLSVHRVLFPFSENQFHLQISNWRFFSLILFVLMPSQFRSDCQTIWKSLLLEEDCKNKNSMITSAANFSFLFIWSEQKARQKASQEKRVRNQNNEIGRQKIAETFSTAISNVNVFGLNMLWRELKFRNRSLSIILSIRNRSREEKKLFHSFSSFADLWCAPFYDLLIISDCQDLGSSVASDMWSSSEILSLDSWYAFRWQCLHNFLEGGGKCKFHCGAQFSQNHTMFCTVVILS